MDEQKLQWIINIIREEVPTNAISHGNIAGDREHTGDDPPIRNKKKKRYIYGGPRSRTAWMKDG
tara:strand:+ start:10501 stop:10692 length:192 start_codon:yes stop_codon:yes gene_type:complete